MENKWKFSISGILCLVFFCLGQGTLLWFFRSYFFLLFIVVLLVGAGISLALLAGQRGKNAFEVRAALPRGSVGKNREIPVGIFVQNRKAFPGFPIEVSYELENAFTGARECGRAKAWAIPGRSPVLDEELQTRHYGMLTLQITGVLLWDWFHLAALSLEGTNKAHTLVMPMTGPGQEITPRELIIDFPGEQELGKRGFEFQPDAQVREYLPGDELRSIHWKLTAKKGAPMVRERKGPGRDMILLVLGLGVQEEENDGLMESCAQLGTVLLEKGYPLRLCWANAGGELETSFLAEQGELERCLGEILSICGKRDPGLMEHLMEVHFPKASYVMIRNGVYKGEYIRQE